MLMVSCGVCAALWLLSLSLGINGGPWSYTHRLDVSLPIDEHDDEMPNLFIDWMRGSIAHNTSGELAKVFVNGTIPSNVQSYLTLQRYVAHNNLAHNSTHLPRAIPQPENMSVAEEATALFSHLGYLLDPTCITDKSQFWYRQHDGRCNWLKAGQSHIGSTGYPRSRDWGQTTYADGISEPREGPNPREVSNAFFKRKARLHYDHTPLMLGLVEFIMHDVTYSADSTTEYIDVPIPAGDPAYDPEGYGNATFRVWRTLTAAGSGTSPSNPREHANEATAWLDCSSLYGSTPEVVDALREHVNGKLKYQRGKDGLEYLPFNQDGLPMRTRPGVDIHDLFLGGDVRTNEDWILLSVHTLFLREHNRLCNLLVSQHPDWDDERIYQTVKLLVSAKLALIGNAYQMAYWTDSMPWPREDGFPLYRAMYGDSVVSINPANTYPWPLVTRNDRPTVISAEMSIVYRFHEFIISQFPIKDERNRTIEERDLFSTAFDSKNFLHIGADSILRGMLASDIPNFKSGVDEAFRSAGRYRGSPFDIVTWSIVHEREQGLPTFNKYYEGYAQQTPTPAVHVKIRKTFEDFSTDPEMVAHLRRLYKTPDDVDLVVGVQLEEELFPGTTMPVSALIPSLFSLFGVGNSDRFSPGFAVMRCILIDKPWNCRPSNALEELLWVPQPTELFPNARWFDAFWMKELDLQAHGTNLLWRMITENSGVKCIQKNPLFPFYPETNPILCEPTKAKTTIPWMTILSKVVAALAMAQVILPWLRRPRNTPTTNWGAFIVGCGQQLQKDPKGFLVQQAQKYGYSTTFGIRLLGSLVYYICPTPVDIDMMMNDEPRASFHAILKRAQFGAVVGRSNFAQDLHASVVRRWLEIERARVLPAMADVISRTVDDWLNKYPLKNANDISGSMTHLVAYVMSRVSIGRIGFDDPELIEAFIGLNTDAGIVYQVSNLLPSFVARIFSNIKVHHNYATIKPKILPVIRQRRKLKTGSGDNKNADDLLGFFLDATDEDTRVAELVAGVLVGGMVVSVAVTNGLYDIAGVPGLQAGILSGAPPQEFVADRMSISQWGKLRSAVLETLRLSACAFGPVREVMVDDFKVGSDPQLVLPKGSGVAASQYLVHYDDKIYPNASEYVYNRFTGENDVAMGSAQYLTFGLPPHTCPGRFLAIQMTAIALNAILNKYDVQLCGPVPPGDRYTYSILVAPMPRKPLALKITKKSRLLVPPMTRDLFL